MVQFMNRSIDLLEEMADESANFFGMNRRGYIFLTADQEQANRYKESAEAISQLGAGPIRYHERGKSSYMPSPPEGFDEQPTGADIVYGSELIRSYYPFINEDVVAMLHTRRCGWLSAQQFGMYMLDKAKEHGARLISGRVTGIEVDGERIKAVQLLSDNELGSIQTPVFVNAAGPYIKDVGAMIDVDIPVFNELHGKISFNDTKGIIPRDVPLMIWSDPVYLPWSEEEKIELKAYDDTRWMLDEFPVGVHFRPEGLGQSPVVLILWTYDIEEQEPVWPPKFDDSYPEIVLRGLTRMVPALSTYINRMGRFWVDGGYYCKTQENRPLITPLPVDGAYLIGALSGFGVMACSAGGELLANHITGDALPGYAPDFLLSRYQDPEYQELLQGWDSISGQL
jgi:glycine/D-amino acid oxidase-like deaminating enzyme